MAPDSDPRLSRRAALAGAAAAALSATALSTAGCGPGGTTAPRTAGGSVAGGSGSGGSGSGSAAPGVAPSDRSSAAPGPVALPAEVVNGPRDRPAVALTFHGQGDEASARRLLAALADGGARVTVLAVGTWLTQLPAVARLVLDGGHELGNHTEHHLAIASMGEAQAYAEINDCATTLKSLTGSIGRWFRPSQTKTSTATIRAQAARVGYPTCLSYDVDPLDYTDPGAPAVTRNLLSTVQNGSIVSLHFGHPGTITALPAILDGLRTRGLRAVTMTDLLS